MVDQTIMLPMLVLAIGVLLYAVRAALLPKPIPGIAHHKASTRRLLGDIPAMIKDVSATKEIISWFASQCVELNSPIIQLFIRPLGPPMVFLADWRESQDILLRRTREFDRSDFFGEVLLGILPKAFISMQTTDVFRHQRRLLASTMSPSFLNQVAAPRLYFAALDLVELWKVRARLAHSHPFAAPTDIHHATLDAIWAVTFGESVGTTKSQYKMLDSISHLKNLDADQSRPADFPTAPTPEAFDSIVAITDSLDNAIGSPLPAWHHWLIRQTGSYKKALKLKNETFDWYFKNSRKAYSENADDQKDIRSAVENVQQNEAIAAKKEGRRPNFESDVAKDELFGFLVAGHETTSTTMTWAVKYLSDNPDVQTRLRKALFQEYTRAAAEQTNPSSHEIVKANIPYMDAVIEEILRCSLTSHGAIRNATVDTEILGYHIPKGTDVYMLANGPDFMGPSYAIDEARRHSSTRANKDKAVGSWDRLGRQKFNPERWLRRNDQGIVEFDPKAGPQLAFGQGPRGCFGKRLAYIELRTLLVLIVWNFELQKAPEQLSSYKAVDKLTHRPQQCFVGCDVSKRRLYRPIMRYRRSIMIGYKDLFLSA